MAVVSLISNRDLLKSDGEVGENRIGDDPIQIGQDVGDTDKMSIMQCSPDINDDGYVNIHHIELHQSHWSSSVKIQRGRTSRFKHTHKLWYPAFVTKM